MSFCRGRSFALNAAGPLRTRSEMYAGQKLTGATRSPAAKMPSAGTLRLFAENRSANCPLDFIG
jgi:hypothetical protein